MAEYRTALGKVVKGDYAGSYIWKWNNEEYWIVSDGPNFSGMKCYGPTFKIGFFGAQFGTVDQFRDFLRSNRKCVISTSSIERITAAGSYQTGPSAAAFVDGALTAGIGYGMAKAMNSVQSSASVAVYMKNGEKMMIEFYSIPSATCFQNDMFIF